MIHLAQLEHVPPQFVVYLALVVMFVSSLAVNIVTLVRGNRTQKREISFADQVVGKDYCDGRHAQQESRLSRVDADLRDLRIEAKHDREQHTAKLVHEIGKVHERINEVLSAVSRLDGRVEELAKRQ